MRSFLCVFAAALAVLTAHAVLPSHAIAQQAPAPAASEEENFTRSHLRAAQRLIDVTRAGEPIDEILPALMSQTRITFVQTTPALAREIEDVVGEVAIEMAAKRAELARTMQMIWARRFSEEELNELVEFFTAPTGKKFADQTPVVSALTMGAARQWESQLATEMVNLTRERLREKGLL